jgi:hypothetical protein
MVIPGYCYKDARHTRTQAIIHMPDNFPPKKCCDTGKLYQSGSCLGMIPFTASKCLHNVLYSLTDRHATAPMAIRDDAYVDGFRDFFLNEVRTNPLYRYFDSSYVSDDDLKKYVNTRGFPSSKAKKYRERQ